MIVLNHDTITYIIGTAREIRSLYRNLATKTENYFPRFVDTPIFHREKMYGIAVNTDGEYTIVNETNVCCLLMEEMAERRRNYV